MYLMLNMGSNKYTCPPSRACSMTEINLPIPLVSPIFFGFLTTMGFLGKTNVNFFRIVPLEGF